MLTDDGRETLYTVPGARAPRTIGLPVEFFHYGLHLVLEPKEIALLLAITDQSRRPRRQPVGVPGVALPQLVRWSDYGISPEVYESAHELQEFGFITIHDTMQRRRRGKAQRRSASERRRGNAARPVPFHRCAHGFRWARIRRRDRLADKVSAASQVHLAQPPTSS